MEMIPSPQLGFLRGIFLANHLASNDNLARTTKRQNTTTYSDDEKATKTNNIHNKKLS